jgi:hypothetical protein
MRACIATRTYDADALAAVMTAINALGGDLDALPCEPTMPAAGSRPRQFYVLSRHDNGRRTFMTLRRGRVAWRTRPTARGVLGFLGGPALDNAVAGLPAIEVCLAPLRIGLCDYDPYVAVRVIRAQSARRTPEPHALARVSA